VGNGTRRPAALKRTIRLRTKFLLSLLVISAGLTGATLSVVSYSVEKRVRQSLQEELHNSVRTYQTFEKQREATLVRSAELIANLPNLRALMSTQDAATIQDESADIWKLSGSDLLVLANRTGKVVALQAKSKEFTREQAQESLQNSMQRGDSGNWWLAGGDLHEVWLQPVYFGAAGQNTPMGFLAVGHEVDASAARDFSNIVSSEIVFRCGDKVVASTLTGDNGKGQSAFALWKGRDIADGSGELQIGEERYLVATVDLSDAGELPVTLSVLKSLDKATQFLRRLNQILLGLGLLSVLAGGALVFLISHTFTKPLSNLVDGVRALELGDYEYPLEREGSDEVGQVTGAFDRMRVSLKNSQAEQKQLEDRLRQAHKMEAVGRLAGGVAHDFNNLLTIIRGNSDLLLDRGESDQLQQKYVGQIQKAADRAVSMTRQLLAFSRMQVLQPRVLDLNLTISEMSKMIPRLIGEDIEFTFVPEQNLSRVLADPGQIEQVFLNLAVNARDAMPNGGELTVRTRNIAMNEDEARKRPPMPPGDYVLLSVSDNGHGMDADTRARIFEPFFTTKEIGKGTGLGLATVYGIVKQSGGFIWVESTLGQGATFEVYLPRSREMAPKSDEKSDSRVIPGGDETILVVEDETDVRELASEFLKAGGYTVLEAGSGAEALKVATSAEQKIHLLLTDMVMPQMSGAELAERMRRDWPNLRILFMTGYSEYPASNEVETQFGSEVLQKPFSGTVLLEKVRHAIGAANGKELGEKRGVGPTN
jgi:signal transduction histidine kinase/ActR/RegA family two-component response regulator